MRLLSVIALALSFAATGVPLPGYAATELDLFFPVPVQGKLAVEMQRHKSFTDRLFCLLDASAEWCGRNRAYLPPYLRFRFTEAGNGGSPDIAGVYALLIQVAQQSGELRADLDASHLGTLFHFLYFGALTRWLTLPGLSLRAEFRTAVRLFVEGAGRRDP